MRKSLVLVLAAIVSVGVASAQDTYFTGFEPPTYSGSPQGVSLNNQDSWFRPPVAGSIDYNVHTYAGNIYGVVNHPTGGGEQFAAGRAGTGTAFARAQRNQNWASGNVWTVSYDVNAMYTIPGRAASQNLGSWSLQDSATQRFFQSLFRWDNPATPTSWRTHYIWFDAAGNQNDPVGLPPGPEWVGLQVNHWYRQTQTFDLATNRILSVSITDLHTGNTATVNPVGAYLHGGQNPPRPLPIAFRLFTGGSGLSTDEGNLVSWDNINIVPEPASVCLLACGVALVALRRR